MPKLKTNKSAAKRFKKTASGGHKHYSCGRRHNLGKKSSKKKSNLSGMRMVSKNDNDLVKRMLEG